MADPGAHDLLVSVVSADAELWTGEARQVIARTLVGQIGLLAGHQPVLGVLAEGEVQITTLDGDVIRVNAQDGFLSMQNNVVTVVAGAAELL
ncbi:MAG TPA: F0F1 ATP synthase subunit epsilon [Pseudolysinimonas sp.]|nr:F0F1 ATP synthase subunit epsilon [Pseudolysinimonas sp.]